MAEARDPNAWDEAVKGIWRDNPVFIAVLGLCPAMAVTNSLINGAVMGLASTFVLVGASFFVSMLRKVIPKPVRISIYIIIIATFVTMVDFGLAAYMPAAHRELGAFIALIVVNCLILGRQEAFASRNKVGLSLADAIGMSLGFTLAMVMIGGIREILGSGTLGGFPVFGSDPALPAEGAMVFEPWVIMVLPPGGFLSLGALLALFAHLRIRSERKRAAGAAIPTGGAP
jgi:electron transport complex protein RnfE